MLSVTYAECHYAECRYAECRGAHEELLFVYFVPPIVNFIKKLGY
jgi:hypothetical protein